VGLSQVIKVTPVNQQVSVVVKYGSGGSLELVPIQPSGSSTVSGGSNITWGHGYLLSSTDAIAAVGPAVFYLAATGATAIAQVAFGDSVGATII
jgi:hypothetical protein